MGLLNQPNLLDTYDCPKCRNKITIPRDMKTEDQKDIATKWRSGGKIEAIMVARRKQYLGGLAECSILVSHISRVGDRCVECSHALLETGITYCPACNGLNLNW